MDLETRIRKELGEKVETLLLDMELEDTIEIISRTLRRKQSELADLRSKHPAYVEQTEAVREIWLEMRKEFLQSESQESLQAFCELMKKWGLNPVEMTLKDEFIRLVMALQGCVDALDHIVVEGAFHPTRQHQSAKNLLAEIGG